MRETAVVSSEYRTATGSRFTGKKSRKQSNYGVNLPHLLPDTVIKKLSGEKNNPYMMLAKIWYLTLIKNNAQMTLHKFTVVILPVKKIKKSHTHTHTHTDKLHG